MIRDILSPSLVEILPPSILRDEKLKAAAQALDVELKKLSADSKLVLHLPRLNELPNEVLDLLAWAYHVDFYRPSNMDLETKRALIRESLHQHRVKGTKYAVEKLLNTITRGAKVSEWYEYGGKEYFFKVNLQGLLDYGDEGKIFLEMINATKNIRSWLDAIDFDLTPENNCLPLILAIIENQCGDNFFDLNDSSQVKENFYLAQSEIFSGNETFGLDNDENTTSQNNLRAGFIELISGEISIGADIETPDEETREDFERYIRERWLKFKTNPIVKWYKHGTHGDDYDGETDDGDEEFFPVDTSFLRIYWQFPCGEGDWHLRYQTILQPKEPQAKDINYLSEVGVATKMLLHSKLDIPTTGILKALYVKKSDIKII